MTKSKFMRVAAVLMAAVLLTTCAISGTFAKYVTGSGNVTDGARVAAWGITVTGSGALFNSDYEIADSTIRDYQNNAITYSVDGASTAKVVAPGTSGSLAAFEVTGTTEVAVNVAFTGSLTLTGWTIDADDDGDVDDEYCPLVITVNGTDYSVNGTTIANVSALVTAVNGAINGSSKNYAPGTTFGTDVGEVNAGSGLAVSWAWDFDNSGAGTNDAKDTKLAKLASAPQISLQTSATVTQID